MNTPEHFRRDEKPDADEESQLNQLAAAAEAARIAGVYDPREVEGEN